MGKKKMVSSKMNPEYDFNSVMSLSPELKNHKGEWLIIIDGKIVFQGNNVKELLEKSKKAYPHKIPYLMKVPSEAVMLL